MGAIEQKVKALIEDRYGSVAEFARTFNLSAQTLSSIFNQGHFESSRASLTVTVARALEIDPYWLVNNKIIDASTRFRGYEEVPLFNSISAGQSTDLQHTDDRFPIPTELADRYPNAFLLRVSGTSMNRVLPNGCYALIERCSEILHSGQPYAVTVGSANATVKRVFMLENGLKLVPDSDDPTSHAMVFDYADSDSEAIGIVGRVVWYTLPLNWRFY